MAVTVLATSLWASPAFSAPASIQRASPSAEATPRQRAAPQVAQTKRPAPASSADATRYAAKDAQAPDAKRYRGGHETAVYVSASAVAVVLAVVLLIVLL